MKRHGSGLFRWVGLFCLVGLALLAMGCANEYSPEEIGVQEKKIIGGVPAERMQGVGALVARRGIPFCSGALIQGRTVLTAAHCIQEIHRLMKAGTPVEFRLDLPIHGEISSAYYTVTKAIEHPASSAELGQVPQNDLGLLFLDRVVHHAQPLPVVSRPMDSLAIGTEMVWTGYGLLQTTPFVVGAKRRFQAILPLLKMQADRLEGYAMGRSACSGDSGGPVLLQESGGLVVAGVISYGMGTKDDTGQSRCDGSSVAFRVDVYRSWMEQVEQQEFPACQGDSSCGVGAQCRDGVCVPTEAASHGRLCRPCSVSQECGGNGNFCARLAEGYRCLQTCGRDDACPAGYACGTIQGVKQCLPLAGSCSETTCKKNDDCGAGEICRSGKCSVPDVAVAAGACGACQSGTCAVGQRCVKLGAETSRCLQACEAGVFCPSGYACQEIGGGRSCVPVSGMCGCQSDRDCSGSQVCRGGQCQMPKGRALEQSCDDAHPCAPGLQCAYNHENKRVCQRLCGAPAQRALERSLGTPGSFCRDGACGLGGFCADIGYPSPVCFAQRCEVDADCSNGGSCMNITGVGKSCVCSQDSQCKTGRCEKGLFQQIFRKDIGACAPPPPTLGEVGCMAGTTCRDASKDVACHVNSAACVCRRARGVGERCSALDACATGLVCANLSEGSVCLEPCVPGEAGGCSVTGGACVIPGNKPNEGFCGCSAVHGCPSGRFCQVSLAGGLGYCNENEQAPRCGDGVCSFGEDCSGCAADCGCADGASCYQGVCQEGAPISWLEESKSTSSYLCDSSKEICQVSQAACEGPNCAPLMRMGCQSVEGTAWLGGLFGLFLLLAVRRRREGWGLGRG
ncbi:MAG: trypsin-like serine protease [Myxococcales bacterium]|nr:trypsin-like serine protease [Myxococcales bacterium]